MNPDSPQNTGAQSVPGIDPYAVQAPVVYAEGDISVRPTGLTVIAVISLLAGLGGLLSGLLGLIGMFVGEAIANAMQQGGPEMAAQQQMQVEMNAITQKYMWISLPLLLAGIVIAGCLAAGGIGILSAKSWARTLLVRLLPIAIVVELIKGVTYTITQFEMGPIMQKHMSAIAGNAGNSGGAAMGQMMQVMTYVGLLFMAAWMIAKIGMMVWARLYLNKPITKAYLNAAVSNKS